MTDKVQINPSDVVNWENPGIHRIFEDQMIQNLHVSEVINRIERLTGARPSVKIVQQRARRYREKREKDTNRAVTSFPTSSAGSSFNIQSRFIGTVLPPATQQMAYFGTQQHHLKFGAVNSDHSGGFDLFQSQLIQRHCLRNQSDRVTGVKSLQNVNKDSLPLSRGMCHQNDVPEAAVSQLKYGPLVPYPIDDDPTPTPIDTEKPTKLSGDSVHLNPTMPSSSESATISRVPSQTNSLTRVVSDNSVVRHSDTKYVLQIRKVALYCLSKVNFLHTITENVHGFNGIIICNSVDKEALDDLYKALIPQVRWCESRFKQETIDEVSNLLNTIRDEMDTFDFPFVDDTTTGLCRFKSILGHLEKTLVTLVETSYEKIYSLNTFQNKVAEQIHVVWILVNEIRRKDNFL